MENTNKIGPINIQNNDLGYSIIGKEYVGINTSELKRSIANSNHVKSYLNTPFHSILNLFLVIPEIKELILPKAFGIVNKISADYRCINSTFYNKPPNSKWKLGFHQDVRINLKYKLEDLEFSSWIERDGFYQVRPPIEVLENIIAIRIHLDDCKIENGALKVVPRSHKQGFIDIINYKLNEVEVLELNEGEVLSLSPLLLHASGNNITAQKRRVIHLEFSNIDLPWYEEHF